MKGEAFRWPKVSPATPADAPEWLAHRALDLKRGAISRPCRRRAAKNSPSLCPEIPKAVPMPKPLPTPLPSSRREGIREADV